MFVRSIHKPNLSPGAAQPIRGAETLAVCQIAGCSREIPRRHLMCQAHWFEVPADLRDRVTATLTSWLDGKDDVRPYLAARLRAIISVANLHNIDATEDEAKLARWTRSERMSRS